MVNGTMASTVRDGAEPTGITAAGENMTDTVVHRTQQTQNKEHQPSLTTSKIYKIQNTRYKIQDTRYKIQYTRYNIQDMLCEAQST